jgi:hypothetical protein
MSKARPVPDSMDKDIPEDIVDRFVELFDSKYDAMKEIERFMKIRL